MLNKLQLLQEARSKSLLIDTGPLSLLLVGAYNTRYLDKFIIESKKVDKKDFELLVNFLQGLEILVTPHVLAETNNIVENKIGKRNFKDFIEKNMLFIKDSLIELYISKDEIFNTNVVLKFGVTDTSLFLASKSKILLTMDWALRNYCKSKNIAALHLDEVTSIKLY